MFGSKCLNVEKMVPFVNIIKIGFRDLVRLQRRHHRGIKIEPSLRVCGIAHSTWVSFDTKYEAKLIVGSPDLCMNAIVRLSI